MFRSSRETHLAESGANGAGRDNDDFVAIFAEGDGSLDYKSESGEEWLVCSLVDDGARA